MSIVFAPIKSEKLGAITLLVLRIGMSSAFFWAGFGKASNPAGFGMMLQQMMGMEPVMATNLALAIGIAELLSGVFILLGFLTRPTAIFQMIILIGAMVIFDFDFTAGPAIWKDPAMLGVAVGLLLSGSGLLGIDALIAKQIKK